jgi:hypothetical protein
MSPKKKPDPGHRAVQCSFLVGLALIVLATVHNVGFDGMSQAERLTLPSFLADTYERTGKTGVTMFLVSLGMMIILTGFVIRYLCGRSLRRGGWVAPDHLAPNPAWGGSNQSSTSLGRVELATQKYLEWDQHSSMQRWEAQG